MLDLDHFKGVNDRGGHVAGDAYARDLAVAWSRLLRGTDLLVRLGGDEFGLLLTVCDEKTAEEAIDRLRKALPLGLSCSAGIATWTPFEPIEHLVVHADQRTLRGEGQRTEHDPDRQLVLPEQGFGKSVRTGLHGGSAA